MNFPPLSTAGQAVSLDALLTAREQRAALQQQLLQTYRQPLLSVTLTAMGEVKKNALLDEVFAHCLANLTACFQQLGTQPTIQHIRPLETGHEAFFVLPMDAMRLKQAMIELEQRSPLGRLWDLDVFDADGKLLSRSDVQQPPRRCLLCEQDAKQCARERRHPLNMLVEEMQRRVQAVQFAEKIATLIGQALLAEVRLTPKPGLVDSANNGAHRDMDITTFERSCEALQPFWTQFVYLGMQLAAASPTAVLPQIRPLGLQAEQMMLHATNGVNTHKGAIFIFGLICTALGRLWHTLPSLFEHKQTELVERLCQEVATITAGITDELQHYPENQPLTHGVKLFRHYGLTGARGEAENGFPLVRRIFPHILQWKQQSLPVFSSDGAVFTPNFDLPHNSVLWHSVLLWLMQRNQDTNVAHRGGIDGLHWLQQQAMQILQHWQTAPNPTRLLAELNELDKQCIERNLSPGGSADLLGLTLFFYLLLL